MANGNGNGGSGKKIDLLTAFPMGMNSGVAPLLLPKEQTAFALNTTFRGGYATDRPPLNRLTLIFPSNAVQQAVRGGFFQGAGVYRPDFGSSQVVAAISGRLFTFTEGSGGWNVAEITIANDPLDPTATQVWMWQSEKWLIISDGSGAVPIFYDGVSCRRSYGPAVILAEVTNVNLPGPNDIGTIITATLSAPYTGPFNVPVRFNGAFYQPIENVSGGYNIVLTNLTDTPGNNIVTGSQIIVNPDRIGVTTTAQSWFASAMPQFFTIPLTSVAGVTVGDSILVPFTTAFGSAPANLTVTAINTGAKTITGFTNYPLFVTLNQFLAAGEIIIFSSSQGPTVVIGNTLADFTVPAVNGTVNAVIDQDYTGAAGQSVWIGDEQYTIESPPASPPGTTLHLLNLTDTQAIGALPMDITTIPEIPACRMGAYGMGQNWFSSVDGLSIGCSDIVGGSSGTQAYNYRDAVLKTSDLEVMGFFRLPVAGEIITSLTFVANLDTSLGQGPLQVGVPSGMFSVRAPFTLIDFQGTNITDPTPNPILTKSLIGFGPTSQNSTVLANSDTIFRSIEGIQSLILARRQFYDIGGNTPISREMARIIDLDRTDLLAYSSAIVFDNRLRMTTSPNVSARGVFHMGELVLNYDLVSSLRGKAPPVWDGLWTGMNILQYTKGQFGPRERAFAFSFNLTDTQIELNELVKQGTEHFDNGVTRIIWVVETPVLYNASEKNLTDMLRLLDGEMYLAEVNGNVEVRVLYRPIFYPCWIYWHTVKVCADMTPQENVQVQEQVRYRLGFGEPIARDCDTINNRPFRDGEAFQLRLEVTGHCKIWGVKTLAFSQPENEFAKPSGCVEPPCPTLACDVPNDLEIYSLDGIPPRPPPTPPTPPAENFSNDPQQVCCECPEEEA